jgi:hypothetical protein
MFHGIGYLDIKYAQKNPKSMESTTFTPFQPKLKIYTISIFNFHSTKIELHLCIVVKKLLNYFKMISFKVNINQRYWYFLTTQGE